MDPRGEVQHVQCVWRDKLVSVKDHRVYLRSLRQDGDQWELSLAASISLPCQTLVIHSIATVLDSSVGSSTAFLLASYSGTTNYELLECSFADKNFTTMYTFDWPQESALFQLLNGPHLVVVGESSKVTILNCGDSKQAPLSVDLASLFKREISIERCWAFDWEDECLLLMARLKSDSEKTSWANLIVDKQCGRVTQSMEHVPFEYGCIATCIDTHEFVSMSPVSGEFEMHRRFTVGTNFNQVLVFEGGALLHCVTVSAPPKRVVVLESSVDALSLATVCSDGRCIAHRLTQSTLKECGSWSDISDVLVGNFAGLGRKQLLALKHNGTEGKQFIATDLTLFSTEESKMDVDVAREESSTSSLSDTVKAFQHRRHEAEVQLTELECELQRKTQLIHSSLTFMNSLGLCGESGIPACDPDMLCIVPGNVVASGSTTSCAVSHKLVKVEHLWKRMECGQWVIGMVLRNISKHPLSAIRCSALLPHEATPTQYSSRIVWSESLDTPTPTEELFLTEVTSPVKRRKLKDILSKERSSQDLAQLEPSHCLCSICTLPPASCWSDEGAVGVTVVVCAVSGGGGECVVDVPVSLSLDEALSKEVKVQESCLSLWKGGEVMREASWGEREHQDLATLLGVRRLTQMPVSVQHTSWSELVSILRRRLPLSGPYAVKLVSPTAPPPTVSPTHSSISESLEGVAVCVCPSTHSSGHMTVMYRSDSQLSLLLTTLKRSLPVDVTLTVPR